MKAKLIESTNQMLSAGFSGREGKLILNGNATWVNTLSDQFYTSAIVSYELLSDSVVSLNTLNSAYIFELIDCEFDLSGIVNIDSEIIDKHKKMKEKKSARWSSQITGGLLEGLISIVTLPEAMDKRTAEEYILKHNVRDDAEGCLIMSLQNPLDQENSCN